MRRAPDRCIPDENSADVHAHDCRQRRWSPALAVSSNATMFVALNRQDASGRDATGSIGALRPGRAQIEPLPGSNAAGTVSALAVAPDQSLYFARTSNADPTANGIYRYADGVI